MTGMETKRAKGKCIANALVCQLCLTFLFKLDLRKKSRFWIFKNVKKRIKINSNNMYYRPIYLKF